MKTRGRLGILAGLIVAAVGAGTAVEAAGAPATTPVTTPGSDPAVTTPTESTVPSPDTWSPGFAARVKLPQLLPAPAEDGSIEPTIEVGVIRIPKIGVDVTLFEGIRLSTLNGGPGHWPGSPLPGQPGNTVFAGHRVSHNADFRNLDQLVPGDTVEFDVGGRTFTYAVTGTQIVPPDGTWILTQTANRTATLFACHPPGSVRERIAVHLRFVDTGNVAGPVRVSST